MSGRWRYAGDALTLSDGRLLVSDREQMDRFQPLIATGATLRLKDNRIVANALLREPTSQREVLRADIRHDLATGRGDADLIVDALVFDKQLQPDTLTHLALGVIANAEGTLRGAGRIDWNEAGVTSTGRFGTDRLDFAAAFGPVSGASGTIEFTDLLGLVTAPDQTLKVAAINPGIEVNDGLVTYALLPDRVMQVKGARWPFLDGELQLRPVNIPLGSDEPVRYVLVIEGIDAARFVQHLDMGNLAATGTFDGELPLVFDKDGGRIDEGKLLSRAPGGNISYVGELTYKDLSPMGELRLRCAALDRLQAHGDPARWAARRRDHHPRQLRRDQPGRGRFEQLHHQAHRQPADPVPPQYSRTVHAARLVDALALRSRIHSRSAHPRDHRRG